MSMFFFFFFFFFFLVGGGGGGVLYMHLVSFDNGFKQICTYVYKNMGFRIVM